VFRAAALSFGGAQLKGGMDEFDSRRLQPIDRNVQLIADILISAVAFGLHATAQDRNPRLPRNRGAPSLLLESSPRPLSLLLIDRELYRVR
jgi:hypothetical protein